MSNRGEAGHRFDAASYELADMIPNGHLLASTDPAGFLECVADKLAAAQKRIAELNRKLAKALSMEVANNRNLDYAVGLIKELHDAWIDPTITVYVADESSETLRWRVERFLKVALPPTSDATYAEMLKEIKRLSGRAEGGGE